MDVFSIKICLDTFVFAKDWVGRSIELAPRLILLLLGGDNFIHHLQKCSQQIIELG
jgi:hypothetical protein